MLSWIDAGLVPAARPKGESRWIGLSGHTHRLEKLSLRDFVLEGDGLYLISRGHCVLWVGSSSDLVAEPASRLRFRKAMASADSVFRLVHEGRDEQRLSVIADLEGAVPEMLAQAA